MTEGAQQALRRTMEIYSKTTRFALACNTPDKIIGKGVLQDANMSMYVLLCMHSPSAEPIQSRCAMLRYSKLSDAEILARLLDVCENEGVSVIT